MEPDIYVPKLNVASEAASGLVADEFAPMNELVAAL